MIVAVRFALLLFLMFLGGPIAILAETYDLLRFDGRTHGQLTNFEIIHGSKGTSEIRATYAFLIIGNKFESKTALPRFRRQLWHVHWRLFAFREIRTSVRTALLSAKSRRSRVGPKK